MYEVFQKIEYLTIVKWLTEVLIKEDELLEQVLQEDDLPYEELTNIYDIDIYN